MTDPLYVIVHTRASEHLGSKFRTTLYDVHPDDDLSNVQERAAELERAANHDYGRVGDTYKVAEMRYVNEAPR